MDILVLGGTGTIGRPLVRLLSKEHKVFYVSRQNTMGGYKRNILRAMSSMMFF